MVNRARKIFDMWGKQLARLLLRVAEVVSVICGIAAIPLGAAYVSLVGGQELGETSRWITNKLLLVWNIQPHSDPSVLREQVNGLLSATVYAFGVLLPVIAAWEFRKLRHELHDQQIVQEYDITSENDDFSVMSRHFKHAESIHVCSGDFSWLRDNDNVREVVSGLVKRNAIVLESYKSLPEVQRALGDLLPQFKMALRLDSRRRLKCSLVRYTGGRVLLYRAASIGRRGRRDTICAVTDSGNGRYLVDTLEALLRGLPKRKQAIVVMGYPGSGKTTAAEHLAGLGYSRASAGDVFRSLAREQGEAPEDRKALERIGEEYLKDWGAAALANHLLAQYADADRLVIEGVRPIATALEIKRQIPNTTIVYLETPQDLAAKRLSHRDSVLSAESYLQLCERPMEAQVGAAKEIADQVIRNAGSIEDLRKQLVGVADRQKRMS